MTDKNTRENQDEMLEALTKENQRLKKSIALLQKENSHLEAELSMAYKLKYHLMPNVYPAFPDVPDIDIFADSIEIRQMGGDYYDFFRIDADHIGVVMCDVFDGGKAAALYMVFFKIYLISQITLDNTIGDRIGTINDNLCWDNEDNLSLSAVYGVYEISTGIFRAVNAGHEPILMMKNGAVARCETEEISYLLGVMEGMKYQGFEVKLDEGDKLILYTDGVVAATDGSGTEYGADRLAQEFEKTKDMSAEETIAHLEKDFSAAMGKSELLEDASYLCLMRKAGDK